MEITLSEDYGCISTHLVLCAFLIPAHDLWKSRKQYIYSKIVLELGLGGEVGTWIKCYKLQR